MAQISISNLTVEFAIFGAKSRSLKNQIISHATGGRVIPGARDIVTVRALDHLDLQINDGDRVGLVGHNGSGKTTLLRVLAGIYKPSAGTITIRGRVGALLDPHAGMDPESTGIENIYLRGYMLGMSRREITAKLDEIVDFTELGEFLSLPLRTYSAGMYARLAFAVSTAAQHDILLIDEGIGAGDASFQLKARQRIEDLIDRTRIVVLASHSEDLIARFCNRRLEMAHGKGVLAAQEAAPAAVEAKGSEKRRSPVQSRTTVKRSPSSKRGAAIKR
ncbi:MAG: ABC transporter ATP-binding protein [Devosia sp.]|nr:ABC transporter ATP-binding protein [Devosia sp.]